MEKDALKEQITNAVYQAAQLIAMDYRNSARGTQLGEFTIEIASSQDWRWRAYFNLKEYWKYVEYGRRKGAKFPPIDVIRSWIQVKRIQPYPLPSGKLPTLEQLTFLISRHISRDGIPPRPWLQQAIDSHDEDLRKTADAIGEMIAEEIGSQINEVKISTSL